MRQLVILTNAFANCGAVDATRTLVPDSQPGTGQIPQGTRPQAARCLPAGLKRSMRWTKAALGCGWCLIEISGVELTNLLEGRAVVDDNAVLLDRNHLSLAQLSEYPVDVDRAESERVGMNGSKMS